MVIILRFWLRSAAHHHHHHSPALCCLFIYHFNDVFWLNIYQCTRSTRIVNLSTLLFSFFLVCIHRFLAGMNHLSDWKIKSGSCTESSVAGHFNTFGQSEHELISGINRLMNVGERTIPNVEQKRISSKSEKETVCTLYANKWSVN